MQSRFDDAVECQEIHSRGEADGDDGHAHVLDEFAARHDTEAQDRGDGDEVAEGLVFVCHGGGLVHGDSDDWGNGAFEHHAGGHAGEIWSALVHCGLQ